MERLNKLNLTAYNHKQRDLIIGPLQDFPERAIQFGEGNFLRAFVDWMIDTLNRRGLFNGKVVVVQPIEEGMIDQINEQDGLYSVLLRGIEDDKTVERRHLITSVSRGIHPYHNWDSVLQCAHNPDLRFIFSNTTEAGIAYRKEDYLPQQCPRSFPAKVAAFLYERFRYFNGDPEQGMIIIPCELIDKNGQTLRSIVLRLCDEWQLGEAFKHWLEAYCYFFNTLVDRIVPGYPQDEDHTIFNELGYIDRLLTTAEIFHLWVIEGSSQLEYELPLQKAGLNVIWTDDLTPYRTLKVRILNGAHTSSVLAAYLCGLNTVGEMMDDKVFNHYLHHVVFHEILPSFHHDEAEKQAYAQSVMERFRNPFIQHSLLSISLNSISKWKVRVLPSLLDYVHNYKKIPNGLAFSLAALICFYRCKMFSQDEFYGFRDRQWYPIRDHPQWIRFFQQQWDRFDKEHDVELFVTSILSEKEIWEQDMPAIPFLCESVKHDIETILQHGMATSIKIHFQ